MDEHAFPDPDITALLAGWRQGDALAGDALMRRVYANVRTIAARSLRAMPAATLNATDLAHEALLRLIGSEVDWVDRQHFFSVATQATRQVLIDAARKRLSGKRGGNAPRVALEDAGQIASPENDERLVRIDDALSDLAANNPRHAKVVEMVYFGGLNRAEIAAALGLSDATVDRDLRLARAWLKAELTS